MVQLKVEKMTNFYTSDTHFGHTNILAYCPNRQRYVSDIQQMEDFLVERWNSQVGTDDTVYHLGDFAMGDRSQIPRILSRLNGKIVLIAGNHDHKRSLSMFPEVHDRLVLDVGKYKAELVHNPGQAKYDCDFVVCGHVHQKWQKKRAGEVIPADDTQDHKYRHPEIVVPKDTFNVGVDVHCYYPVAESELIYCFEDKTDGATYVQKKLFNALKVPAAFIEHEEKENAK